MDENDRDREVPGRDVGAAGAPAPERTSLGELARLFLKLGTIAFGGPAAHVAMMEDEVVRRRGWLTRGQFLDYLGATNLIPGPNSTELAIHVGHARAGWAGLLAGYTCGGAGEPCPGNYFRPNRSITRAQVAKVIDLARTATP